MVLFQKPDQADLANGETSLLDMDPFLSKQGLLGNTEREER